MAADRKARGVDIVHGRQQCIGIIAACGAVFHGVAVFVCCVVLVKKAEVREVRHDLVASLAADGLERAVFHTVFAVVDGHLVIDIAAVDKTFGRRTVAVLVQTQNHRAAPGQLDGVGRAGLMVVLVAVQQQNAGHRCFCRGCLRGVKLIQEIADVGFNPSLGDRNDSVSALVTVGGKHAAENDGKQQNQRNCRVFSGVFHKIALLCFVAIPQIKLPYRAWS